jgi:ADP-heptose:LPS heptosyltransferase
VAVGVVLVLRALGLGDLLTGVPALRGLRRAYPDHRIVLATPPELTPLALASGAVDEVLPARGLAPLGAPARPDVAVNLHGRGPESHRLLRGLRPGRLVAFRSTEADHAGGPDWYAGEYEVARWCRLLAAHGIPADPGDLALPPPQAGRPGRVVVHPGAAHPRRRWPAERFAAVARELADAGEDVVVTGSAAEEPLARGVAAAAGLPPGAVLAGRTDAGQLAGIVAAARLVVCGDTGVAHLATAYGTPSVVLFGPAPPAEWGPPPGRPAHVALWRPDAAGRDTGDGTTTAVDPALRSIGVADVLGAAVELLGRPAQPAAPSMPAPPSMPAAPSMPTVPMPTVR